MEGVRVFFTSDEFLSYLIFLLMMMMMMSCERCSFFIIINVLEELRGG